MQSVTRPRVRPSRRIEWISLVVSTAPVAPIGWPWAMAPPSTLTMSSGKPELARDDDGDGCEGFVDLDALDGADVPAGALQGLLDRGHRSQCRTCPVRPPRCRTRRGALSGRDRASRPTRSSASTIGRSGIVQSGRVAGGDGAVRAERGLEPRQRFERRVGPVVLVLVEWRRSLLAGHFDRHDLRLEMTGRLRRGEALLRAQRPAVLRLARDLVFLDQVLGVPAGVRVGEGVVQAVAQHAVIELAVAHAVAPATARDMR